MLAQMSEEGHASIALFRAEQRGNEFHLTTDIHTIACVHSVLYKGPVEEMPETLSAEHPGKIRLPNKEVRFFALESFVQSVAELGPLALQDKMVGQMLNKALQDRIRVLIGFDAFDAMYCEALAELARDYPVNSQEWNELAFEVVGRFPIWEERGQRSPELQFIIEASHRRQQWKNAQQQIVSDEEALAKMYVEHGMPLPGHLPRRIRIHLINPFAAAIEYARMQVLDRIVSKLHIRESHDLDAFAFPPHWLCKRLKSPFRKIAAMPGAGLHSLITGGAIISGRMLGFQELITRARVQVLKRIILKRSLASVDTLIHYWPLNLVRRQESPLRKAMVELLAYFDVKTWGENIHAMAKALPFEHLIFNHQCWRYFRLGFPTDNYDFQAELHDALVDAGLNDCYYRFVPSTGKKWGIEVLDPWTEEIFPLQELPARMGQRTKIASVPASIKVPAKKDSSSHMRQTQLIPTQTEEKKDDVKP